jgi:ParB family chromosome partitioning protein
VPAVVVEPPGERVIEVPADQIKPNPFQPRTEFDEAGLDELADSLKTCGVLSPLLVRKTAEGYELIAGERRLRAARRAGFARVPVVVRKVTDAEAIEHALIENLQRRDLNPMEKARALHEYLQMRGLTQAEGEKRLGMSRSEVANHVRLLKLTPAVQESVRSGALSYGHARALVAVEDPARQSELARRTIAEQLSVRQLEELLKAPGAAAAKPAKGGKSKSPQIRELEDEFSAALGVKVSIRSGRNGKTGLISIPFSSLDAFDRIRLAITGQSGG